jgi:hypothetical protein
MIGTVQTKNPYRPTAAIVLALFMLGVSGIPLSLAYCSMDAKSEDCCCGTGCCSPEGEAQSSHGDVSSERAVTGGGLCCVVVTTEPDSRLGEFVLTAQLHKETNCAPSESSAVRAIDPFENGLDDIRPIPPDPLTPYALRTHLFISSFLI